MVQRLDRRIPLPPVDRPSCIELCSGGGGTALGLEMAGFGHQLLAEIDGDFCATLRRNRPSWPVVEGDINELDGADYTGADLLSAGLPCTPFSRGGKQLGADDERDLWPTALRIIGEARPRAVMLETAKDILSAKFDDERAEALGQLHDLGYQTWWQEIDCSRYGVPQRRLRSILVGLREPEAAAAFRWPDPVPGDPPTVGDALYPLVAAQGWTGADAWRDGAQRPAPTVTGGSTKHGGADLGASQGKAIWRRMGIDPMGIADGPPGPDGKYQRGRDLIFDADETGVMLTVPMAARLQGFPPDWEFAGKKTAAYRQVGNAFCPPAAMALGLAIATALQIANLERARRGRARRSAMGR